MQFSVLIVFVCLALCEADADLDITIDDVTTSSISFTVGNDAGFLLASLRELGTEEVIETKHTATDNEFASLDDGQEYIVTFSSVGSKDRSFFVKTAQCPDGWIGFKHSCYKRIEKTLSRWMALQECGKLFSSAHLADPRSIEEYEFITSPKMLPIDKPKMYWFGINVIVEPQYNLEGVVVNETYTEIYTDYSNVSDEVKQFRSGKLTNDSVCVALNPPAPNWSYIQTQCDVAAQSICEYPVPHPPTNVSVSLDSQSAVVTWEAPKFLFPSNLSTYQIHLYQDSPENSSEGPWIVSGDIRYETLNELNAGRIYFATVIAADESGGGGKSAIQQTYSFLTDPPGPYDLSSQSVEHNEIHLVWTQPEYRNPDCFSGYLINYTNGNQEWFETAQGDQHVISGLSPLTDYIVSIEAVYSCDTSFVKLGKSSAPAPLAVRTRVSPVSDFEVNVIDGGFETTWTITDNDVEQYELQVSDENGPKSVQQVEGEATSLKFEDLVPGQTYNVTIVSIQDGERSKTTSVVSTTRPSPLNEWKIQRYNQSVDTAYFAVKVVSSPNDIFDGYRLEIKNENTGDVDSRDFETGSKFLMVDGLVPGTNYYVLAYTTSMGVLSSPAYEMEISLDVAAPKNFRYLSRNETSVLLGWDRSKGSVTSYLITCDVCPGDDAEVIGADEGDEALFRNLYAGDQYIFTIQARNENADVRPSETIRYITRTMPYPSAILSSETYNRTNIALRLVPTTRPDALYSIECIPEEDQYSTVIPSIRRIFANYSEDTPMQVIVTDLTPGISYNVTVRILVGDTYSTPEVVKISTEPSVIQQIEVLEVGEYWSFVRWIPGEGGFDVFDVTVTSLSSGKIITKLAENITEYNFTLPKPAASYELSVKTVTSAHESTPVVTYIQTMPLTVTDVEIADVTETSFTVRWNPPKSRYEEFRVVLSSQNTEDKIVITTKSFVTFTELSPGTLYELEIFTTFNKTDSYSVTANVVLFPQPPLSLTNTGTTSNSLTISWDKPKGHVESYTVEWEPHDGYPTMGNADSDEVASLFDLIPGVMYDIQVYSKSWENKHQSRTYAIIQLQTDEDFPGIPLFLNADSATPTTIEANWTDTATPNGIILQHIVRYRQVYPHPDGEYSFKNASDSNVILEDLEPGSYYILAVRAQNSKGFGNWTNTITQKVLETVPGPVSNLMAIATELKSLNITWESPATPNGEIVSYILTVTGGGDSKEIVFTRDSRSSPLKCFDYNDDFAIELFKDYEPGEVTVMKPLFESLCPVSYYIDDLSPFTLYTISVVAKTEEGLGFASTINATTLEETPSGPPRDIIVTEVGPDTVTLEWLPPVFPNGDLTYTISVFTHDGESAYQTKHTTYTLSELEPFSIFAISMYCETNGGVSYETDWLLLNTTEDVPGRPQNLSGRVMNSESAYLTWQSPADPRGIVTSYEIEIRDVKQRKVLRVVKVNVDSSNISESVPRPFSFNTSLNSELNGNSTDLIGSKLPTFSADTVQSIIKDLRPYTEYDFAVRAVTSAGSGTPAYLKLTTSEDKPASSPTNLKYVNLTSTSVNLTWSKPEDPNGEITSYSVMYISKNSEMRTEVSDRTYVVLDDLLKNSPYSVYVNSKTLAGEGPSSERLQVYTEEDIPESPPLNPRYFNISKTVVRVEYSPPTIPNGVIKSYTIYYRNKTGEFSYKSNTTTAYLENLKVYGEYWVTIAASTKFGDGGQRSVPLYVRTGEGEPGTPPLNLSLSEITSTSAKIKWKEPEEPNGIITSYEILVKSSGLDEPLRVETPGADTEFTLQDLIPVTSYQIFISARTKHGDGGQVSDGLEILTLEDAPSTSPQNLRYSNITSTSILLMWDNPEISNGVIEHFTIYYGTNKLTSEGRNATLEDLLPYTAYEMSITASTSAGEGPNSTLIVYTEEDVPTSPPREVTYTQLSSTEISLSWLPPLQPNGVILSYDIEYTGESGSNSVTTNQTNVVLSDLEKFAQYSVTISANTKFGNGDQKSIPSIFQTLEDAPSDPPYDLTVLSKTATSFQLSWLPPKNPNGVIQYYTVYLTDDNGNTKTIKVINRTTSLIENLDKYTWYDISLSGSTALGDGNQRSEILRAQTLPGAPESGVQNLDGTTISSTEILISWSPPERVTGLFKYLVHVYDTKMTHYNKTIEVDRTEITLKDLKPFEDYTFDVTVFESITSTSGKLESVSLRTFQDAPSMPVLNLRAVSVLHNSVVLVWEETPEPNGIIISHVIDIPRAKMILEIHGLLSGNVTIDGLDKDTEYNASVVPKTVAGTGPPAFLSFVTTSGVPEDPPTMVKVHNTQAHSVQLSWHAPQIPNGKIVSYKLVYEVVNTDDETLDGNTKFTIRTQSAATGSILSDLDAYKTYSVSVAGTTKIGDGPLSEPIEFTTLEDVPTSPILQCRPSADTAVTLSWKPPLKPNGVILSYEISGNGTRKSYPSDAGEDTISNLLPHSFYKYEIWAVTKIGKGEKSSCLVKTEEGVASSPGRVQLIRASNSTLSIQWTPPLILNGELLHYELFYKPAYMCWSNGGKMVNILNEWICKTKAKKENTEKTLIALQNYVEYTITIGAVTGAGLGDLTEEATFRTKAGVPSYKPRNVTAFDVSSTAINVSWVEPLYFAGPTTYQAKIYLNDQLEKKSDIVGSNTTSIIVSGLDEATLYETSIVAMTVAGSIESKRTDVHTDEDAPSDPPAMFKVSTIPGNSSAVKIEFLPPEDPNGGMYEYELEYKMIKDESPTVAHMFEEDLPYLGEEWVNHTIYMDNFLGGRTYYFRMKGGTLIGYGPWTGWSEPVTLPVNPPPVPSNPPKVAVTDTESIDSTSTLEVDVCVFSTLQGPLSNITVIVAEVGADLEQNYLHWFQAYYMDPSPPYKVLATSFPSEFCDNDADVKSSRKRRSVDDKSKNFVLGDDQSCVNSREPYCNGPLKSDTPYTLKLRGTTTNGEFTDTEFSEPLRTHPTFLQANLYLLIGLGCGIVFIILIVSVTVHCLRKKLRAEDAQRSSSSPAKRGGDDNDPTSQHNMSFVMEPTNAKGKRAITRPVAKSIFTSHVSRMSEHNDKGFLSEFEEIESVSPYGPKAIGGQAYNSNKNRFADITPYDHYRVKISDIPNVEGSGYINASYIPGLDSPEQYIATQCPLGNTKNDFWRMIWETGAQKIIMLANVDQDGTDNISKHWPSLSQTTYFGNLAVQCQKEERKPEWTVRTFSIAKRDKRRQVTQYHFTLWPLRGVPDNPHPFARFLHSTRAGKKHGERPVVVMCSSGSGRTAVYIAVDSMIDVMGKENRVDPCGVVSELRNYRPYMIQTVAEYAFLHRCLAHVISHHNMEKSSVRSPTGDGVEETTMF